MLLKAMSADWLKLRRTWMGWLVLLGPIGVIGLQSVNYGLRYDYLLKKYADDPWGNLIINVQFLAAPALLLGITLIASIISGIEHREQSWKQVLALPISRSTVFASKFTIIQLLLFVACTLLSGGTLLLGGVLGLGMDIPWEMLLLKCYFPWLAAMPIIALQSWLSITNRNQALPISIGILVSIFSMYAARMPDWMPLKWPLLVNGAHCPIYSVIAGLCTGLVIYMLSLLHFARKDVD
ncbi:ABC transporter permease [Paenibacillus sp. ACRRX]|uniref:ABC transporter permease n=1 Tax=Paenibacillus sp. ACRRX TaxID=2918206 RepID=UPI001EF4C75C|nr:ABC transporter permease [Paenibacillus sp. ACRRX]MCG7409763.1 ABC transporter permease [Paenibacillus sp. ACRRX]